MDSKNRLRRGSVLIAVLGLALWSVVILGTFTRHPVQQIQAPPVVAVAPPAPAQAPSLLPIRLKIPTLNIDSAIEALGLTADGEMATTKDQNKVAWYQQGQRPGESGSAVIAGHSGWKNGTPAAFDHLNKLQIGDKLYIEDEKGATITFVVRELRDYGQADDAKNIFSSSDGKAHLNLITCEGIWNEATHSYSKRLVAFADKQ